MTDAFVKRPSDIVRSTFDLQEFVDKVSPAAVSYRLQVDEGIGLQDVTTSPALVDLVFAGGQAGRVFDARLEVRSTDGQSVVMTRRVRVRDTSAFAIDVGQRAPTTFGVLGLDGAVIGIDGNPLGILLAAS